jgi:Novel toxin 15
VIAKIRAPIDKAIDAVIAWIVSMARKIGSFIAQAGVPKDPNERLRLGLAAATTAVNALRGPAVTATLITPVLGAIKVRYGMKVLQPVETGGDWWIEGEVNPKDRKKTAKKAGDPVAAIKPMTPAVPVTFTCNTKKYDPGEYDAQLKGQEAGLNAIPVDEWAKNRQNYKDKGRPVESGAAQEAARELVRQELRDMGKSDKEIETEMAKLAALHEPDMVAGGRISIKKLGSRFINSSIGSQWRTKVKDLDDAVKAIPEAERPKFTMNVKLTKVDI